MRMTTIKERLIVIHTFLAQNKEKECNKLQADSNADLQEQKRDRVKAINGRLIEMQACWNRRE